MRLFAYMLVPVIGLSGCAADYSNDEVARTVIAAGAGYAIGKYVEKNGDRDDRHRDRNSDHMRECRDGGHDRDRCDPHHRHDRHDHRH